METCFRSDYVTLLDLRKLEKKSFLKKKIGVLHPENSIDKGRKSLCISISFQNSVQQLLAKQEHCFSVDPTAL